MSNHKPTIGLVFGGNSSEHNVSIQSAKSIYNALSNAHFNERFIVHPIYINKYGFWGDFEYSKSVSDRAFDRVIEHNNAAKSS